MHDLAGTITALVQQGVDAPPETARAAFLQLRDALSTGAVRVAEPDLTTPTGWRVNSWVKEGIALGLRVGRTVEMGVGKGRWPFFDNDLLPMRKVDASLDVRIAPGGSSVREGAFLAPGTVCMPPMYVNIGAYVGEGTLIDSHALVGACAQVGRRVQVGVAAQIGSGLEPSDVLPVIIEDDVQLGAHAGVFDGAVLKRGVVLAPGTLVSGRGQVYDVPRGRILEPVEGQPIVIPEGALVVPGARAVIEGQAQAWGLSLATAIIVEYNRVPAPLHSRTV